MRSPASAISEVAARQLSIPVREARPSNPKASMAKRTPKVNVSEGTSWRNSAGRAGANLHISHTGFRLLPWWEDHRQTAFDAAGRKRGTAEAVVRGRFLGESPADEMSG